MRRYPLWPPRHQHGGIDWLMYWLVVFTVAVATSVLLGSCITLVDRLIF
jgi:hypothetical protein